MSICRKMAIWSLLFIFVVSFTGCYTIKVGGNAQLASSDQEGNLVTSKRYWYALYGLIPLGDNSTDNHIPASATKVRVETKYTILDFFINIFTGWITIYTFTAQIYEVK
ncbi:MAG: hypothetical protein AMK69_23945 [Nitrospira bacterium SG8_3]|nr:MAG: hypothetical protein AMK69_23945 [Nitrospira bacterium SG8_3]